LIERSCILRTRAISLKENLNTNCKRNPNEGTRLILALGGSMWTDMKLFLG